MAAYPYSDTFICISFRLDRCRSSECSLRLRPSCSRPRSLVTRMAACAHCHRAMAVVLRGKMDEAAVTRAMDRRRCQRHRIDDMTRVDHPTRGGHVDMSVDGSMKEDGQNGMRACPGQHLESLPDDTRHVAHRHRSSRARIGSVRAPPESAIERDPATSRVRLSAAGKRKSPASPRTCGALSPLLAETEGFEPSIQVLAQMLP